MLAAVTTPAPTPAKPASSDGEEVLFDGHPPLCPSALDVLVAVITLGFALVYFAIRSRSVHYRVTNQRVVIETGLLNKRMDQVDVYRINDYVVERPLGQRMVGTGNIILSAMDRSTPDIRLFGLKTDVMALYEKLRKATEEQKRARGVRTVDAELPGHVL